MAAIGEGFEVLENSQFDFDYEKVARVWNHGSVIRSWLMGLTERAFAKDAKLDQVKENGRWKPRLICRRQRRSSPCH